MPYDDSVFGIKAEGRTKSLKALLDVPEEKKIPKTFLRKIKNAELGSMVENPTQTGRSRVKVTRKLKQKVMAVWNLNYNQ